MKCGQRPILNLEFQKNLQLDQNCFSVVDDGEYNVEATTPRDTLADDRSGSFAIESGIPNDTKTTLIEDFVSTNVLTIILLLDNKDKMINNSNCYD